MKAPSAGIRLTARDAAIAKGMLLRGDRQHDIAAYFGVNGGRIAELSTGAKFPNVEAVSADLLPPKGPYDYRVLNRDMKRELEKIKSLILSKDIDAAIVFIEAVLRKL